ncbi:hypothetical protein TRFO_38070 [Tritrichomonas foetus]|uniref:Ankyrin repeat protein n=1 Tax=Tritrichomonas foetus TaxID=1144522 RepID=A0A1J4JAU7_9EUKA|nr:hypothetical protein TRFO_38070 [Tritrichomonas foetus]|eukprot:OHS95793.1 hypothetical protein TRFO_38070 [Tritrichomonas foetus]
MMEFTFFNLMGFLLFIFYRAPLHLASRLGAASIVEFLLSKNADPNVITVEKDNALHFAAQTGFTDIGQLLIKFTDLINAKNNEGVSLYFPNQTPLHIAAANGSMDFFVLLAENGGDLETKDRNGWTPLHFATHDDHLNIVQYLLDHRVDFNPQTVF